MHLNEKILFVDDDENLLAAFQRSLRRQFNVDTAAGGADALRQIELGGPYALAVVDMRMPGLDGIQVLEGIRDRSPHTVRFMLTGNADQRTAIDAVNRGQVYRFINKPAPPDQLIPILEAGLEHHKRLRLERELLEGTLAGSIRILAEILGSVAPEALGRGERLRDSIGRFARFIKADPVWELEVAALLSSIGWATLPARMLERRRASEPYSGEELQVAMRLPQIGHDLIAGIPRLQGVATIILFQQKHFDGSELPDVPRRGAELPLGARMLKILNDRFDLEAEGVARRRAHDTMAARTGVYDPQLLEQCFACFPDYLSRAVSADLPVVTLPLARLKPDQVAVSDIKTRDGSLLVGSGHRLTPLVLQRLANYELLGDLRQPILVQDPTGLPR